MIAESHIALHTFPERALIWVDIFSCKDFDAAPVVDDLRHRFGLREMQVNILERGLEPAAAPRGRA
jgi:S-adenosylmethionine decarboxylase